MSDWWSTFDPDRYRRPGEEREEDRYGSSSRSTEPYRRNFFERLVAPIDAPQQALYQYTLDKETPFLPRVAGAIAKGAEWFLPWTNPDRRITEDEIREEFLGKESSESMSRFWKGATNLGIALLYDPLWLLPPLGAARKAIAAGDATTRGGQAAIRALRATENVVNPISGVFDAASYINRKVLTPTIRSTANRVLGPERAALVGATYQRWMVDRFAGSPEWVKQAVLSREQQIGAWHTEGYQVLQGTKRLGGRRAQELLSEALELDAVYYARRGADLTTEQASAFERFTRRLDDAGIDKDLFMESYDAMRALDDKIGHHLLRTGAISSKEFAEYQGVHARRMFEAFEKPNQYIGQLEALAPALQPDRLTTNSRNLVERLRNYEVDVVGRSTGSAEASRLFQPTFGGAAARTGRMREFVGEGGRLDVEKLAAEFQELLWRNPSDSVEEILLRTQKELFGLSDEVIAAGNKAGGLIGEFDAKMYKALAETLTGGDALKLQRGAKYYADLLRNSRMSPGMGFRTVRENMAVITERQDIPQEILDALGEVTTAAPRMAEQVSKAGVLAETMELFDTLSNTRRITPNEAGIIQRLTNKELSPEDARRMLAEALDTTEDAIDLNQITRMKEGDVFTRRGSEVSRFSEASPMDIPGATRIPDDPSYGSLRGAWVSPSVHHIVTQIAGGVNVNSPVEKAFMQAGRFMRSATQWFKLGKVVYDPTAQMRNFWGNAVMASFVGLHPLDVNNYGKAARTVLDIHMGRPNVYLDALNKYGQNLLGGRGYLGSELDDLARVLTRKTEENVTTGATGLVRSLFEGIGEVGKAGHNVAVTSFAASEQLFRSAVFIQNYDRLRAAAARKGRLITDAMDESFVRQAVAKAEQGLFNYADIPYAVQFARDYGIVPFITFPYKAAGLTARTVYEAPYRMTQWHRTTQVWNDTSSGSPEQHAKEVAALPQHIREALVVRLPFTDMDERPLYADLSYLMPYLVFKELAEIPNQMANMLGTTSDPEFVTPTDFGIRGGYFTPPLASFMNIFQRGEDNFGRTILKQEYNAEQSFQALGNAVMEFILPPSWWGGQRAETFGKALQAVSRSSDEPIDWVELLALPMRGFGPEVNQVFGSTGQRPASGALVGGSQWAAALGLDQGSGVGAVMGVVESMGLLPGSIPGGAVASDPTLAAHGELVSMNLSGTELMRQRAAVIRNQNLTTAEKKERIDRIMELYRRVLEEKGSNLRAMR